MTQRSITRNVVGSFVLAWCAASVGSPARADIPPPDACDSPGASCGRDGTCTCATTTCVRIIPCSACPTGQCVEGRAGSGESDGGPATGTCRSEYPCNRCRSDRDDSCTTDGAGAKGGHGGASGRAGEAGAGGAGTAAAGQGGGGAPDEGGESGCSCSANRHDDLANGWLFTGALVALGARRRRLLR
jgi:MYXO-CTERM domain-containing protein